MDFLHVTMGDGKTFRHELDRPKVLVGRSSKNDLVLPDLSLSRVHAEVFREGQNYLVKDAGSKNGTLLNGRQVTSPTVLKKGDQIVLGTASLWFNSEPKSHVEITDNPTPVTGTTVVPVTQLVTDPSTLGGAVEKTKEPGRILPMELFEKASDQLVATAPLDDLLGSIMDLVFEAVKPERGFLMLLHQETGDLEPKVVRDPGSRDAEGISLSRQIADLVVKETHAVLTSDALHDPRFEHGESIVAQGIRSAMCVPLWNNRKVIGLVYADSRLRSNSFSKTDLRILTNLANIAAIKIENNRLFEKTLAIRRMERDLELAAQIQQKLIPQDFPPVEGYEIAGTNLPSRTVGGDTLDFLPRQGGRFWLAVGDVAGKGLPAAMIMSHFQAMLRGLAESDRPLSAIVGKLNEYLTGALAANQFISFILADLEPATGIFRYVNAGHNLPIHLSSDSKLEWLKGSGPVLGVINGIDYQEHQTTISPGDSLLMYSDGATESINPAGEEFGEERLVEAVKQVRPLGIEASLSGIEESLLGFCGTAQRYDDITLFLLRRPQA